MFKKLLPLAGIVFIATVMAVKTDWDEKLEDDIQPLFMVAAKIKAAMNGLS